VNSEANGDQLLQHVHNTDHIHMMLLLKACAILACICVLPYL
jgi:hypothetical protein